ncbi:MAG: hypothetical protein HOV68_25095 [Streptomycetaceae bacterium]|nr:hypothetical protein [Streptomycetaceae bacterium]
MNGIVAAEKDVENVSHVSRKGLCHPGTVSDHCRPFSLVFPGSESAFLVNVCRDR